MNNVNLSSVAAVIVTYNGNDNVFSLLSNLSKDVSLIVVDNGSNEDYASYLKSLKSQFDFELTLLGENKGIASALNVGIAYANKIDAKYLLTLDQDSLISIDSVKALVDAIDEENGLVSTGTIYKHEIVHNIELVSYLITSGNLTTLKAINEVNGFDDRLFIDQVDIDFSYRLRLKGYKLAKVEGAILNHKIGEKEYSYLFHIPYYSHSAKRFYYIARNERFILRTYHKSFKFNCLKSRIAFYGMVLKVIFIERNKHQKLTAIRKGWKDGKRCF